VYIQWCQTYGYLPSCTASPPTDWYQIILLGDGAQRCEHLAQSLCGCTQTRSRIHDLLIACPTFKPVAPLRHSTVHKLHVTGIKLNKNVQKVHRLNFNPCLFCNRCADFGHFFSSINCSWWWAALDPLLRAGQCWRTGCWRGITLLKVSVGFLPEILKMQLQNDVILGLISHLNNFQHFLKRILGHLEGRGQAILLCFPNDGTWQQPEAVQISLNTQQVDATKIQDYWSFSHVLFIQLYKLMTHKLMTLRATASEIKTLGWDRNIQIFIYSSLRTENRQVMTEKKKKKNVKSIHIINQYINKIVWETQLQFIVLKKW